MPTLKYIFFILLVILVSLFASKNMHTVEIFFFDGHSTDTIKVPVMLLIAGSFGVGFLIVWFFELFTRLKLKTQLHMRERKIKMLESELVNLKQSGELTPQQKDSIPVSDN